MSSKLGFYILMVISYINNKDYKKLKNLNSSFGRRIKSLVKEIELICYEYEINSLIS